MGLARPLALWFLALVPALVLAYLTRERPARVTVSSVLGFRALRGLRAERFGGRPRLDWTFFVELLLLLLAVLAMAGPYMVRPTHPIAVVLDNSAAMKARTASGRSRFAAARGMLDRDLAARTEAGEVTVYLSAPQPHRLAAPFAGVGPARTALSRVVATDVAIAPATLARLLGRLLSERRYAEVIFAGSNPVGSPAPRRLKAMIAGEPIANVGLASFGLRREAFGSEEFRARLTVANFGPAQRKVEIRVTGDGREVGRSTRVLEPGEAGMLEFPHLPEARRYVARLSPADGFMLDNAAYATAGSVKAVSILFVSPSVEDARGLEEIPGVVVRTSAPADFSPEEYAQADVAIFEYAAPKEMPAVNTLLVMPPESREMSLDVTAADKIQITGWHETEMLADSVNFRLVRPAAGEFFAPHPWMSPVVTGNGGALLLRGERSGHRYAAIGFNPFPYLGRRNLPMSVLTLNLLSYLAGLGTSGTGYRTGQPWLVPAGVHRIILPSGKEVRTAPGRLFTDVSAQGIYQLVGPGELRRPRAVNLSDLSVSRLNSIPALKVEVESNGEERAENFSRLVPLGRYVLGAIIALAALEALLVYRRRRAPVEANP